MKDDVLSLQTELRRMQCFLRDAEKKQEQNERVRNWVAEVRDLACEIEDVIEVYIHKFHLSYIKAFLLRKLRTQINSIKDKSRSLLDSTQTYQIKFTSSGAREGIRSLRSLRRSYPDDEEDIVISLKDTTVALKAQLMTEEDQRRVVSIVGMGGLGKTTLAKKVYNDVDIKKHFDCFAWVFISQQYLPREVLSDILMQVGFQSDQNERSNLEEEKYTKESLEERKSKREILKGLEHHELVNLMKFELEDKRYFIVLDDIWSIDAWYSIQSAFPNGKVGSKVLFTTRVETVALSTNPHSPPVRPPLLTSTESWTLLQCKVFQREYFSEEDFPSQFEAIGKEMVEKCGGLPLAIVVLGGILRTKSSFDEWEKLRKHVKSHVISKLQLKQQYRVEDILDLSFQDLSYYLKPCFLYLGSFPEDSEISKRKLIRLWIAEGFVPTVGNEDMEGITMEDIAEQFLGELIDRCMVQVSKKDHTGKGVKTCRLHDIMRDFCISKAKKENFFEMMQLQEMNMMIPRAASIQYPTTAHSRRIAIHANHGLKRRAPCMEQVHPHLRSFLCHGLNTDQHMSFLRTKNFTLLRVLELDLLGKDICDAQKLPSEIGSLILLRYLTVSGICTLKLPYSIGSLQNLNTLDLRGIHYAFLPWTISKLGRLRHLLFPEGYSTIHGTIKRSLFRNSTLVNLETLKGILAEDLIRDNAVLPLTNIRNLEIKNFRSDEQVRLVLESLSSQLDRLRSLRMQLMTYSSNFEFPSLKLLSECRVLSSLSLTGELSQLNFSFLPKSLAKLVLEEQFSLDKEKLAILQKLPNLRILQIMDTADTINYKWLCSVDGFPKLEILTLCDLLGLKEWKVEIGAMPILKILNIHRVGLREIPHGLKYVSTLRELNISSMPKKFRDRLMVNEDGLEGKDFYKVRHIPSITFSKTRKG
ncbi:NB-ARC domain, LRR domain containing protein [Parasponia andersonii]|uniref:NB-ARC domain, LRR domain containing protein n=1 Tax=Parasponia andersonii TaxID=3476 RepID=A0A2P5AAD6_PARAD|nr:NB-ARC domain, LRR domain containing protein [Parasponia andersonii]